MHKEIDVSAFASQIEDSLLKDTNEDLTFELPADITFLYEEDQEDTLIMRLNGTAPHNPRIREDEAAFESWALIIKAHQPQISRVKLDWTPAPIQAPETAEGPYRLFLYRVWKFAENFIWFDVYTSTQREQVKMMETFFAKTPMVNTLSTADTGPAAPLKQAVITYFMEEGFRDVNEKTGAFLDALYGPMPVSLRFPDAQGALVFEAAHRFIPLWGCNNDVELCLFDLKVREKGIGALSELFFNAHYMFDLYCAERKNILLTPPGQDTVPGGPLLFAQWFDYLSAGLLSDALHPAITPKVVKTLQEADNERLLFREPIRYRVPKALLRETSE
jgi:hypothetical protein